MIPRFSISTTISYYHLYQFSSVQSLSSIWLKSQHLQASLSITNSRSLLKPMSIELVMPSSHLILCRPLLLLPSIPPSIRVFSNESTLRMRWPEYWSFSFSINPSSEHPGLISFRMDWLDLLAGTVNFILNYGKNFFLNKYLNFEFRGSLAIYYWCSSNVNMIM